MDSGKLEAVDRRFAPLGSEAGPAASFVVAVLGPTLADTVDGAGRTDLELLEIVTTEDEEGASGVAFVSDGFAGGGCASCALGIGRGLSRFEAMSARATSGVDMAVDVVSDGLSSSRFVGDEKASMERKSSKLPSVSIDCRRMC